MIVKMRYLDRTLETIGELIEALRDYAGEKIVWYRGQVDAAWKLVPAIARQPKHLDAELTTIKIFKQNAGPHLRERPRSEWEWMFLMQHHRAPTRLLDWTESPLVGLYFALAGVKREHEDKDAALWFLDPVALNRHAGHHHTYPKEILAFDIDSALEGYLPDQVNARRTNLYPVAAIGPRNSPRMVAQAGTFTIMHATVIPVEEVGDSKHIWRMVIPAAAKENLRTELSMLGINEHILFPDLDRVADVARSLLT